MGGKQRIKRGNQGEGAAAGIGQNSGRRGAAKVARRGGEKALGAKLDWVDGDGMKTD
jgi:hypothetical protein